MSINPAPPHFIATCNLSPSPPATKQFSLTDEQGNNVANLIWVDVPTTISVRLSDGASFSASSPIEWSLPPVAGEPTYALNGNTLSFDIPPPTHVFYPWAFRIVVDVPGAVGIRSQNIYLAKPSSAEPEELTLKYVAADGTFSLLDSNSDSEQDGVILGGELVMVNVQFPRAFSVRLLADASVAFATDGPVFWSSGAQPDWASVSRIAPDVILLTLSASAQGQSMGFQFLIEITGNVQTVGVLSPDPIIINATIGDG